MPCAPQVPPGEYYHYASGRRLVGPARETLHFALDEVPLFARAGAVVPLAIVSNGDVLGLAQRVPSRLQLECFPKYVRVPFMGRA